MKAQIAVIAASAILVGGGLLAMAHLREAQKENLIRALLQDAVCAKREGDLKRAIESYRGALSVREGKAVRRLLVECCFKAKRYAEVLAESKGLEDEKEILQLRAGACEALGSIDMAIAIDAVGTRSPRPSETTFHPRDRANAPGLFTSGGVPVYATNQQYFQEEYNA